MDLLKNILKFVFKIIFYTAIFTLLFFLFYKYINWNNIKTDMLKSGSNVPANVNTTSEFSPSTLSLGLDYNGSKWVDDFKTKASELGIVIKSIAPTTTNKNLLNIVLENDVLVKLNLNQKFENVWSNFIILYNNSKFKDELVKGVEYIDLRNDNKIYYKLINRMISSSTATSTFTN